MWPVFPRSPPTYSVFIWITHLADMDLGKTFPCICWLSLLSLFLYILTTVWMWIPFSFSIARCFEKFNYTHIFVWRRPCNLINYSRMAMRLIAPVICDSTQGAALSDLLFSLPWVLLVCPSIAGGPLQRLRRAPECVNVTSSHCCVVTCLFLRTGFCFTDG